MSKLTMGQINALDALVDSWIPDKLKSVSEAQEAIKILKASLCSSPNQHICYGELWQCAECEQIFCCVEGDEHDGLCDACWAEQQESSDELAQHWPSLPELDGVDVFRDRYGPPTGQE